MTDLCSLADVKAWLSTGQSAFPSTDDALLARLITAASGFIESWLSRPLGLANWQEIRDGKGGERGYRMQLWATPITNILGVAFRIGDGLIPIPPLPGSTPSGIVTIPAASQQIVVPTLTGSSGALGYTFTPTELCLWGWRFFRGYQNIVVQYTAGYDPIPGDVQQACIEMVVRKYRERTRIAEHSRSLGGAETVAYSTVMFSNRDMVTDIQVLLQQYRQVSPILRATLLPPPPTDLVLEDQQTEIVLEDLQTDIIAEP